MSISQIQITQGSGTPITVDSGAGGDMQVVKLAESTSGSTSLIPASSTTGLLVNVGAVASGVAVPVTNPSGQKLAVDGSSVTQPVSDGGASLTIDAPASAPVSVRLSNGSSPVDTIPVSVNGTPTIQGSVSISGTPSVQQSGTWNVGSVSSISNPVTVQGSVSVSGTPTVQGTVTSNQGSAAATASAWPVKITDGTNTAALQDVGGTKCLPVKVVAQAGGGASAQDETAFTEGSGQLAPVGGVYNEAFSASPAAGQAAVARITSQRALHVNLRKADGTEIGTAAAPVRTDPTGSTAQPVTGTVTANQGGANWSQNVSQVGGSAVATAASGVQKVGISDGGGTAYTAANPLPVAPVAASSGFWKSHVTFGASQSDQTIHSPAAGKTTYVEGIIITPTAAGALLKIYDQTNADANSIYVGMPPLGSIVITPTRPIPMSAANNILRFATGTSAAGDITAWGYDA